MWAPNDASQKTHNVILLYHKYIFTFFTIHLYILNNITLGAYFNEILKFLQQLLYSVYSKIFYDL